MQAMATTLGSTSESLSKSPRKGFFALNDEEYRALIERVRIRVQAEAKAYNQREGELTGYDCVLCKNRGFFAETAYVHGTWYQKLVPCECQKTRQSMDYMSRSGLGDFLREKTFSNYVPREQWQLDIKKAAEDYVGSHGQNWFYLGGQSGIGKTHLCSAIYGALIQQGMSPRYFRWREEINRIKSATTDYDLYGELMRKLKGCDLLYIDDLFKTGRDQNGNIIRPTTADINLAFEVLDYRYLSRRKLTVISSELSLSALKDIDEAIAGRIAERCGRKYGISIKDDPLKNYRMQNFF